MWQSPVPLDADPQVIGSPPVGVWDTGSSLFPPTGFGMGAEDGGGGVTAHAVGSVARCLTAHQDWQLFADGNMWVVAPVSLERTKPVIN